MATWLAVPEAEDGSWTHDPVTGNTKEEVVKLATEMWAGRLYRDTEVVIYQCTGEDVLELPKATD